MSGNTMKRLVQGFIAIAVVLSVAALAVILRDEYGRSFNQGQTVKTTLEGVYSVDDRKGEQVLPSDGVLGLTGYRTVTIKARFKNDVPINKLVMMRIDNLRVTVSIPGKLLYSYGGEGSIPSYVRSAGNGWDYFVSPGISSADEVTFTLSNVYTNHVDTSYSMFLNNLYVGYENSIIISSLSNSLFSSLISVFLACMGFAVAVFCIILYRMHKSILTTLCFASLSFFSGIWFFIDFSVQGFLFPRPIFNNSLNIISMSLTAAFLLLYFSLNVKTKFKRVAQWGAVGWLTLVAAAAVTQMTGILDYYDYTGLITAFSVLTALIIAGILFLERKRHKNKNLALLVLSSGMICIGILVDVVSYQFQFLPHVLWFKMGFFAFMLIQLFMMGRSIKELISEDEKVQSLVKVVEYQRLITEATKGLYESIYEIDVTHRLACSEGTRQYFISFGADPDDSYEKAIRHIAEKQIKPEFRAGYLEMLSADNIMRTFEEGGQDLSYDFMISQDRKDYYWVRISARIFYLEQEEAIHLIVFHQNIDEEKRREQSLFEQVKQDPLTGLYNKTATEELIRERLGEEGAAVPLYAMVIVDIDDFKQVNDTFGHAVGDRVIHEFADTLRTQFPTAAVVGRIGGDEFIVFFPLTERADTEKTARRLSEALNRMMTVAFRQYPLSASIGAAVAPFDGTTFETLFQCADAALYMTKRRGKNGYTIYSGK